MLQLAVSHTNKLYTWGASPQVLRLQTQARKKSKILEYQAAAEKLAEAEFESLNSSNPDENVSNDENGAAITSDETSNLENSQTINSAIPSKIQKRLADNKLLKSASMKDVNIGSLEEVQTHLRPTLVSTSLVNGRIVQVTWFNNSIIRLRKSFSSRTVNLMKCWLLWQVSTGCHHSALLTKDGTVYTWGRNFDGQIGNGTRREVLVPTPLDYNPASVLAQIPPRSNNLKNEDLLFRDNSRNFESTEDKNGDRQTTETENPSARRGINRMIKTVRVCCGCDFTVAIQPGAQAYFSFFINQKKNFYGFFERNFIYLISFLGGTVLAWGSNSMAQLGRSPTKDSGTDEKLVLLKSSRRVVRLPHGAHVAHDTPSQVPNIPTPIISYQSYDVTPLAGRVRPLSVVEKTFGDSTLHYVLEQFHGLYDNAKIMDKVRRRYKFRKIHFVVEFCICTDKFVLPQFLENGDYHACSKLALLEQNHSKSFAYQLKTLNPSNYKEDDAAPSTNENLSSNEVADAKNENVKDQGEIDERTIEAKIEQLKTNTELFDKQVVKNLVDSLEECVSKKRIKMPASRSLDSFQVLEQELHTFDCQGGSEELCEDTKSEDISLDLTEDALDNDEDNNITKYNKNLDRMRDIVVRQHTNQLNLSFCNNHDDHVPINSEVTRQTSAINNETFSRRYNDILHANGDCLTENQVNHLLSDATGVIKFYMNEIDDTAHTTMRKVLHTTLEFWIEHNLPIHVLEKVLLEHINKLFYPLGLLLFW